MSRLEENTASLQELLEAVLALPEAGSGEPALQEKNVAPSTSRQEVKPDPGYDGLSQVNVSAMPTAVQATPSISVSSAGLITASATQTAGYVEAGTKSATKQLTTQAAKTITPSTSSQTAVASGRYTTGAVTVAAIPSKYQDVTTPLAELNAANGGTAASTMQGAVDNTESLVGTQGDLIAQIAEALEGKTSAGGGSSPNIGVAITKPSTTSTSITFSGLSGEPKMFCVCPTDNIALSSGTRYVTNVQYNAGSLRIVYSNSTNAYCSKDYCTKSYSNGNLTLSTTSSTYGGSFRSDTTYQLVYIA